MSGFHPRLPIEWVYGNPADDEQLLNRPSVTVLRGGGSESSDPTNERRLDLSIDLPRISGILGTSREFRVGSGTVRVVLEAAGAFNIRDESGNSAPRFVLQTRP